VKYIGKNEGLLNFLTGEKINILDAEISRFGIYYEDYQLKIDIYMTLTKSHSQNDRELKLQFQNITECCLYHNSDHHFYCITNYKFFKCDKGFYISFDPYEEISEIQPEDNDFIISKEIEGSFL
jgi:hypothetical protein